MNAELNKQCQQQLADLKKLRGLGMPEADYAKAVVCISYEYAVGDEPNVAVGLLMRLPLQYFEKVQADQMMADPRYAEICSILAQRLLAAGVTDYGVPARA